MKIGELVVCVNDNWRKPNQFPNVLIPVKGKVYTVTGMREKPKGVGLYLAEFNHILINVLYPSGIVKKEPVIFNAKHFAQLPGPESIQIQSLLPKEYFLS